jgi:hypothetical protein
MVSLVYSMQGQTYDFDMVILLQWMSCFLFLLIFFFKKKKKEKTTIQSIMEDLIHTIESADMHKAF